MIDPAKTLNDFAAWAKEKFDHVGSAGIAIKHMTVDKIVAEFEREQKVRRDLEGKPDK